MTYNDYNKTNADDNVNVSTSLSLINTSTNWYKNTTIRYPTTDKQPNILGRAEKSGEFGG